MSMVSPGEALGPNQQWLEQSASDFAIFAQNRVPDAIGAAIATANTLADANHAASRALRQVAEFVDLTFSLSLASKDAHYAYKRNILRLKNEKNVRLNCGHMFHKSCLTTWVAKCKDENSLQNANMSILGLL